MGIDLTNLRQITWDEWISSYWIETVSQFDPIVFMKVYGIRHKEKSRIQDNGSSKLLVEFVRGDDGFVYKPTMNSKREIVLLPIYTLKKEVTQPEPKPEPIPEPIPTGTSQIPKSIM